MENNPEFDNNKKYWIDRYNSMPGERVVGHVGWSKEQYNEEYLKWRRNFLPFVSNINKGSSILDFGCGIGRWESFLSEYGEYYGCDIVVRIIAPYVKEIKNHILPFGNKKFDLIWTSVVLQHVVNEALLHHYVKQFNDRLNDGGYVIITENISKHSDNSYLRFRTIDDYLLLFNNNGFSVVSQSVFESGGEHIIILFSKE